MKKHSIDTSRNIGIIAHIDAGKTTLTERLLYYSHKIHRIGEVHDGNATMDYLEEEQKRGITITSACTTIEWKNTRINIIDTPGHVDFNVEVERSLRVCDGAVVVFCAVNGIESQSEIVWRQAEKYKLPRLVFVNKTDRPGADFWKVVEDIGSRFGVLPLPLTIPDPLGNGSSVLDLLERKTLVFDPQSKGDMISDLPFPESEDGRRKALIEALADHDDDLMERYLADEEVGAEALRAVIRSLVHKNLAVPVYCGSALKNMGVQPVMDGIAAFLPSPHQSVSHEHVQNLLAEHKVKDDQFVGFVFKVIFEGGHKKNFLRIYNGSIAENAAIYNSRLGKFEKIHKLYTVHASRHEAIAETREGEIVLATGLKDCVTGDTLFSGKSDLRLENIDVLQPVLNVALVPGSVSDTDKLQELLQRYVIEDPTLRYFIDPDTEQLIVSGLGELHLEVVLERLRRESGVSFRYGNPQVIFLETISAQSSAVSEFKKIIGDHIHKAKVAVRLEPVSRGGGNSITTSLAPTPLVAVARKAMEDALQAGVLHGYVVGDVRAELEAIEPFEDGLTDLGVRMATLEAMKEALHGAQPMLMEPIMDVTLTMPSDYLGDCVNLLGGKSAKILDVRNAEQDCGIRALAPMRQLFGFSTELRSRTKGKAFFNLVFSRYDVAE